MSEVKRYDFDQTGCSIEDPDGRWVDATDFDALRAENERLGEELAETELRALKWYHQIGAHVDLYRELKEKHELLGAELAALKAVPDGVSRNPNGPIADERAAFEVWAVNNGLWIGKDRESGYYENAVTQSAFRGYSAALSAPAAAQDVGALVEALSHEALSLCDAVENINDLPPVKYALQAGRAVNKVRDAAEALAAHKAGGGA